MTGKVCVGCQADMDTDAIFCNECGLAQPTAVVVGDIESVPALRSITPAQAAFKICPSCGKQAEAEVRFCSGCALDYFQAGSNKTTEQRCPGCQKFYEADDIFCRHCAFDLSGVAKPSSTSFCTRCGKAFDRGDKFCRYCSADISQSDHTVAVPIVTAAGQSRPIGSNSLHLSSPVVAGVAAASSNHDAALRNPSGPHWISPSAAAFVVICFFLPWIEWSCFGSRVLVSGAQLANNDLSFLLFPIAAIVTILVYFIFKAQRTLWKARPYIIAASAFGLFLLVYKLNSIPSAEVFGTRISVSDFGFKPQIGGFGTIAGYLLAIIGCIFMSRVSRGVSPSGSIAGGSGWYRDGSRPRTFRERLTLLTPHKAAMLCYLTPLLGPIAVQVFAILVSSLWGSAANLLVFASLGMIFVAQIVFLKIEPQRSDRFVRFHAFQSLFQVAATFGSIFILIGLASIVGYQTQPIYILTLLVYAVGIGNLIAAIFMAVRSNRGEAYKLPVIGDWAASYAEPRVNTADFSIR